MSALKYLWVLATGILLIMLRQIDASMGRIEVPPYHSYTVTGLSDLRPSAVPGNVSEAWCVWHNAGVADGTGPSDLVEKCIGQGSGAATLLLHRYVLIDLLFMLGYLGVFVYAVILLRKKLPNPDELRPIDTGLRIATKVPFVGIIAILLVVAELAEAYVYLQIANRTERPATWHELGLLLGWASLVKWIAVGVAVLLVIALATYTGRVAAFFTRETWEIVKRLRLQIGVATVLAVLLTGVGTDQMQDALLAVADHLSTWITTPVAALLLAVLLWRSVHRTALTDDSEAGPVRPIRPIVLTLIAATVAVVALCVLHWRNLLGLALVLAVVVLLSWLGGAAFWHPDESKTADITEAKAKAVEQAGPVALPIHDRAVRWARLLAAFPLLVLAAFLIRSSTATALLGPVQGRAIALLSFGIVMGVLAVCLPWILEFLEKHWSWAKAPAEGGNHWLYWIVAAVCAVCVVLVVLPSTRFGFPAFLGPVATVTLFLTSAMILGNESQRWSEYATPVAGFRVLRLKRTPVFTIVLAWFLVASILDAEGNHQVRTKEVSDRASVELSKAFQDWASANCATGTERFNEPAHLVIVSASGGGIRAAYWTAGVLHEMFPVSSTPCTAPVFAASGVSGAASASRPGCPRNQATHLMPTRMCSMTTI